MLSENTYFVTAVYAEITHTRMRMVYKVYMSIDNRGVTFLSLYSLTYSITIGFVILLLPLILLSCDLRRKYNWLF